MGHGGTSNTEMNRTLNRILDVLRTTASKPTAIGVSSRSSRAHLDTAPIVSALAGLALESTLSSLNAKDFSTQATSAAILAKLSGDPATETTLADVLAKIIASPATEAKQDAIITADGVNIGLNIAQIVASTTLNIAAIVANSVAVVAGIGVQTTSLNSSLQDIEDIVATNAKQDTGNTSIASVVTNTNSFGGKVIADWLSSIDGNAEAILDRVEDTNGLLNEISLNDGEVKQLIIPAGNQELHIRPDAGVNAKVLFVEIDNGHGAFPVFFRIFEKGTFELERPTIGATVALGGSDTMIVATNIRRDKYILIRATTAAAHTFRVSYISDGTVTLSSPT